MLIGCDRGTVLMHVCKRKLKVEVAYKITNVLNTPLLEMRVLRSYQICQSVHSYVRKCLSVLGQVLVLILAEN